MKKISGLVIVATMIISATGMSLTGCGNKTAPQDSIVVEETCDTIALKEGKIIPFDSVAEYLDALEFVHNQQARRIGAYVMSLDTTRFPVEDWIVTLEAEYNAFAAEKKLPAIAPTREGTSALNKAIRMVERCGDDAFVQLEINYWAYACSGQEDFLDIYSMYAFKVMLHNEPAKYYAMTAMDNAFNKWADAQIELFTGINSCNGILGGTSSSMLITDYTQYVYRLRPMTSFFSAISDPEFKLPNPTEIDMQKAIIEEYGQIYEEVGVGTDMQSEEEVDLKKIAKNAKEAFTAYAEATEAFIKVLPEENQAALHQIVNGKYRKILVTLKNRLSEGLGGATLSENASDEKIQAYKHKNADYWKFDW